MLRSMFAGISGLRAHQTMMDVVGNNIANVNTTGYKAARATFQDALYQVVRGGSAGRAAAPAVGGTNPMQIGLGSQVAAVDQVFSQGALQLTNRVTDVAIQGEGFFVVRPTGAANHYTRAGAFSFDNDGSLVAPGGEIVMGYKPADITADPPDFAGGQLVELNFANLTDYRDLTIGTDGNITARDANGDKVTLGKLAIATFANENGLARAGRSLFLDSPVSGAPTVGFPMENGGSVQGGTLEMSNVDLAAEFTGLIMAQRGFQANARTITSSDEMLQELVNIKR